MRKNPINTIQLQLVFTINFVGNLKGFFKGKRQGLQFMVN